MLTAIAEYNYINDLGVYYERRIESLQRERMKITQRGKLSAAEDTRLDEIDSEVEYWLDSLDVITDFSDEGTEV